MNVAHDSTSTSPMIAASSTLALVHYLRCQGVLDPKALEQITGQPEDALTDPDLRIPADQHYHLWEYAESVTGDPAIGMHVGQTVDPDRMGLMGHVFFNCDTLGEAVTQYTRLHGLINESVKISFEQTGGLAILTWQADSPGHYCRQDMDRTIASMICRARHFIHPALVAAWVEIAHEKPGYAQEYVALFGSKVRFGCEKTRVAFDRRHLSHSIPHRNPYVYSAVLKQVNAILARLQTRRTFGRKIRRLIAQQMSTDRIDADTLAGQCHMSRQTLYRRLKKEGLGFHELVEEVRKDKAMRYVSSNHYALGEIAFLLGFSELSAFSRAFKRWTGIAPAQYRAQQLSDQTEDAEL